MCSRIADLTKSQDFYLKKYCVVCTQKDKDASVINRKTKCSASYKYIDNYIGGFTNAGIEQQLEVECKKSTE